MRRLVILLVNAALMGPAFAFPVAPKRAVDPPGELKVEFQVDDAYIRKVIGNKVGELFADQFQSDDPACRAAAVLVAQEAANSYAYWTTTVDLVKETGKGIELGGKLSGATTVAKAGQLAFMIAEALEDEEPYAALGRGALSQSTEWLKGNLPKTGNETADDQIKTKAEQAADALTKALFPGQSKKTRSYSTSVGRCTVTVTPEIYFPTGKSKNDLGGLWLHIDGDCGCKKPLTLNSSFTPPTTFHGQSADIKNCGLGKFASHAFLPMTRLETSVSYAGTAINLQDLAKKSADLRAWIKDKLAGRENDKKPEELAKSLGKLTKQATTVSPILRLKPIFADRLEKTIVYAKCNNCDDPANAGNITAADALEDARKLPADECRTKCSAEYDAWIKALVAEAEARDRHDKTEIGRSMKQAESELNTLKNAHQREMNKLKLEEAKVVGYQKEAAEKNFDIRELGDIWANAINGRDAARLEVEKTQARIAQKEKELTKLKAQDKAFQDRVKGLAKRAEAAKAAYDGCVARCHDTAVRPRPHPVRLPPNTKMDPCLIGRWVSEYYEEFNNEWRGSGVLLSFDANAIMTVDYSQMRAICPGGDCRAMRIWFTGQASAQINFVNGNIWPGRRQSNVVHNTAFEETVNPAPRSDGGPAFLGSDTSYACDATTLTTVTGTGSGSKKLFRRL